MPTPPLSVTGTSPTLYFDRVQETSNTAGTGAMTLLGAAASYQDFSVVGDGSLVYYAIAEQSGTDWEIGIGTYTLAGTTLSRDTVLSSSNGGALVSFAGNDMDVFLTQPSGILNPTPYCFFDHFASVGSVGTTETPIYTDTTPANTFLVDGDKLIARYGLNLVNSASQKRLRLYFDGNSLLDTGNMTVGATSTNIVVDAVLIRDSSTSIRYSCQASATGTNTFTSVGLLGGLTLTSTNDLELTGTADGGASANDDILGIMGTVYRSPSA